MAVFDQTDERLVVEVIYDGPGFAGKTTNLEQLCGFFTRHRRSEMFSSRNAGERTVFLDWLQLEGGLVCGHKLRCQLITVPGQAVLSRRRWHLLRRADGIVFVIDSTPHGVAEGRNMFDVVRQFGQRREHPLPIVVQANKQDCDEALPPNEIAKVLDLDPGLVIGARASEGVGVRETAVLAIRAVADQMQRRILEQGLDGLLGKSSSGEQIQQEIIEEEEARPLSPLSIMLEQADVRGSVAPRSDDAAEAQEEDAPTLEQQGQAGIAAASSLGATEPNAVPDTDPPDKLGGPAAEESAPNAPAEALRAGAPLTAPARAPDAETEPEASVLVPAGNTAGGSPPLPEASLPSGFVWPAATGRELLHRVPLHEAVWQNRLGAPSTTRAQATVVYQAGSWCLMTSPRHCFATAEEARNELVSLARRKIALGSLLVDDTVLALQHDVDGRFWLWTVTPWMSTLHDAITHAKEAQSHEELQAVLVAYAEAAIESLKLTLRRKLRLEVHPSNFARLGTRLYYVGEQISVGECPASVGASLLEPVEQHLAFPRAVEAYINQLVLGLKQEFSRGEPALDGLRTALDTTFVGTVVGQTARRRLCDAVAAAP